MIKNRELLSAILPRNRVGDALWSYLYFVCHRHRLPRIRRPRTYCEHLFAQRFSRDLTSPLRRRVSDKIGVKEFIAERVGRRYCVQTLAILNTPDEVDRYEFPAPCFIKPAHMSGAYQRRRTESDPVDRARLCRMINLDYYDFMREPNYRGLPRRILVEPFIFGGGEVPPDYKMHCWFGEPKFIQVAAGRFTALTQRLYTPEWQPLAIRYVHTLGPIEPPPANLDEMLDVARKLAAGFDSVRVDLYSNGSDIKVGEITNLPWAGLRWRVLDPPEAEFAVGRFFREPGLDPHTVFSGFLAQSAEHECAAGGRPAVANVVGAVGH